MPEHYHERSPINFVKNLKNPLLLFHGEDDARVKPEQSKMFYEKAKKFGKNVELITFKNEGHGFIKKENEIRVLKKIDKFLNIIWKKQDSNLVN